LSARLSRAQREGQHHESSEDRDAVPDHAMDGWRKTGHLEGHATVRGMKSQPRRLEERRVVKPRYGTSRKR